MSATCSDVRLRLEAYLAEDLSSAERRQVREHLATCDDCGAQVVATDPALLFAFPEGSEVSAAEADAILQSVRAAIAWKQTERRLSLPAPGWRWRSFAASAALFALMLALPGSSARRDSGEEPIRASKRVSVGSAGRNVLPAARPAGVSRFPADATIYDWNPGGDGPRVVWIVDRSLDI